MRIAAKPGHRARAALAIATLLGAAQLGCSQATEDGQQPHVERAQRHLDGGDLKAAAIEYKNALQKQPRDAQARFELAELYLRLEQGRDAAKELLQARELGMDEDRIGPLLGEALLLTQDYKRVLELVSPALAKTPANRAQLVRIHADAQFGLGQIELACSQYQEALNLDAKLASAYWGLARCARLREGEDAARAMYARAIELDPANARTRAELANMEYILGHHAEAEGHYREALRLDGELISAQAGLALSLYLQRQREPALAEIERLRAKYPDNPLGKSLQAMVEFDKPDYEAAMRIAAEVLKELPNHYPTLALFGRAAYNLGRYEESWRSLGRFVLANPENAHVRKLLANALLRLNRNTDALETLAPLIGDGSRDGDALILAGGANTQLNRPQVAARFFERAINVGDKPADAYIALARIQIAAGDHARATESLRSARALQPDNAQAAFDLASLYHLKRDFPQAMRVMGEIERKWPKLPRTSVLKAQIQYDMNDLAGARRTLRARLAAEPRDVGAALNIARIDIAEGKHADARKLARGVLERKPDDLDAMLMLARIADLEGNAREAEKQLEQASQRHKNTPEPLLELAKHHLKHGQPLKALQAARLADKLKADDAEILGVLASAQLAAGERENGLATYHRLASSVLPNSPRVHLLHAKLQLAVNSNRDGARMSLIQAIRLQPDFLDAQAELIALNLLERRYSGALDIARQVQTQRPAAAVGHILEGDVLLAQNRYTAAAEIYRKGLDRQGSGMAVVKLHRALTLAGRQSEAEANLGAWLQRYPDDIPGRLYAAEAAMAEARWEPARAYLEDLLRISPEQPAVLNNLAIVYGATGNARAIEFARRARELAPDNPLIADTLGWMLVERGEVSQGLPLLRQAREALPDHPQINYHLAIALARSGARPEARRLLENLLKQASAFPERAQAEAVLRQLGG